MSRQENLREGERRNVTVLFADMAESTRLSQRLDPEEMGYFFYHPPYAGIILVPDRLVKLSQPQAGHHFAVFARPSYGAFNQCHIDLGHCVFSRSGSV